MPMSSMAFGIRYVVLILSTTIYCNIVLYLFFSDSTNRLCCNISPIFRCIGSTWKWSKWPCEEGSAWKRLLSPPLVSFYSWTCTHPWWKSSRSPLCSIWSCRSRTTSPPSKLLLYEQVSSVKLHLKAHPYFKKLLHWFLWGGLRWPLPGERLDLITGQSGHWPGHLKYKVIYFRSSCCKGRSSSSSLPGIVRDDINLVNTVPVVCFAGSGDT